MKKSTFRFFVLCCILCNIAGAEEKIREPLSNISRETGLILSDETTLAFIRNSSGDRAYDYVSQLSIWDRSQVTPGYRKAAEWIAEKAREFGLQNVTIEQFPSDGKIQYFGKTTQPAWTVRRAELWMIEPSNVKITTYDELPMSLYRNSRSANVEAELVDIGSGIHDGDYKSDVRGKIVLTTSNPAVVSEVAVSHKGAAGVISSWSVPEFDYRNRLPGDFPDQIGWAGITPPSSRQIGTFAFLISSRQASQLQLLLHQGKSVRLHAIVDAEISAGTLDIVSAQIPGSKYPNEEIILTAHLDHHKPGANDNASGSASILEMARTLVHLISTKQIPPPLRTIRFLWVPEWDGTRAWIAGHLNDPVKRLMNLNFDMLGENLRKTNSIFLVSYTPDANPSYLNAVMESILDFMNRSNDERYPPREEFHIISQNGTRDRLQGRMMLYQQASDSILFNGLNVPATFVNAWPDDFYHSNQDTPDKVDPTQLHRAVFCGLAAMTTIAYADDPSAAELAKLVFLYAGRRIHTDVMDAQRIALTSPENMHWAQNKIRHAYTREKAAVESCGIFIRSSPKAFANFLSVLDRQQTEALRNLDSLGTSLPVDSKRQGKTLIPHRVKGQELKGLDYVEERLGSDSIRLVKQELNRAKELLKKQGADDFRAGTLDDAPAMYADGTRTIAQIGDAIAAEYVPVSAEAIEAYFRAFEKAGVMTLESK